METNNSISEVKIRSYHITTAGDIKVIKYDSDEQTDVSSDYQNISTEKGIKRINAYIDVYRDQNSKISIKIYCNQLEPNSMNDFQAIIDIFQNDLKNNNF